MSEQLTEKEKQEVTNFAEKFWKKPGAFVKALNEGCPEDKRVEKNLCIQPPCHVYGIVLNWNLTDCEDWNKWKFCKIGFTRRSTSGRDTRMKEVEDCIKRSLKNIQITYTDKEGQQKSKFLKDCTSILFVLRLDMSDGDTPEDIESAVRECFGFLVNKEVIYALGLPIATEWVVTTQRYLDILLGAPDENGKRVGGKIKRAAETEYIDHTLLCSADVKFDTSKVSKSFSNVYIPCAVDKPQLFPVEWHEQELRLKTVKRDDASGVNSSGGKEEGTDAVPKKK